MPNTNCLHGMQCPTCQSIEPLAIEASITVRVYDEGTDDQLSSTEWDEDSYCDCCECQFVGTVKDL